MLLLAIETSTPEGGAALWRDGRALAVEENDGSATHSVRLMPAIDAMLRRAALRLSDLDGIAVSAGPGSFTGLRIGMALAKALAMACGKPIAAVSTLEALAWRFAEPGRLAAPMLDARRGEVYAALFRRCAPGGALERLCPDVAETPEAFARRIGEPCLAGGLGARRHAAKWPALADGAIALAGGPLAAASPCAVAVLGASLLAAGRSANPLTLEPFYVRKSDVEIAKARVS